MNAFDNSSHNTRQVRPHQQAKLQPNPKSSLRAQVHEVMRFFHYSPRTEETYWQWIERFLRFHRRLPTGTRQTPIADSQAAVTSSQAAQAKPRWDWRHPREMGELEAREFLTHLATALDVSASTQNQALNALVFLYGQVLHQPLGEFGDFARVRRAARVPEVLSRTEVARVLEAVEDEFALPLKLLYGSGLRLFGSSLFSVE